MSVSTLERGPRRVQPEERFEVRATVKSGLQKLHPEVKTGKVNKPDPTSYRRDLIMLEMGPSIIGVELGNGRMLPVQERENKQVVVDGDRTLVLATFKPSKDGSSVTYSPNEAVFCHVRSAKIVPVAPWGAHGEPADMVINFDPRHQKFDEAPRQIQALHLAQRANTLQALLDAGENTVYTGRNTAPVSWRGKDAGLQTAMFFHDQGHGLPSEISVNSIEATRQARHETNWDRLHHGERSASSLILEPVADFVKNDILPNYWASADVEIDPLGFTVFCPGLTVQDFGDMSFADKFLIPIAKKIHPELAKAHELVYASAFADVEEFTRLQQYRGEFDMDAYEKFFMVKKDHDPNNQLAVTLNALAGSDELRHGFGWVFGAQFQREGGALFEFTAGILRSDVEGFGLGPAEGRRLRVDRGYGTVPVETVRSNADFLRRTVAA